MDRALYKAVNRWADRTSFAHGFFRMYAKDGIVIFAVLLVVGWWIGRAPAAEPGVVSGVGAGVASAVWAGAGALIALAINQPIGSSIARTRPYNVIPNVHLLIDKTKDFTFTSDHATIVGGVAAGLWFVNRRLGVVTAVLALLMAFARVYVGAHYPTDVIAGLALGAIVTVALRGPALKLLMLVAGRLEKSPLRPLVTSAAKA